MNIEHGVYLNNTEADPDWLSETLIEGLGVTEFTYNEQVAASSSCITYSKKPYLH